MSNASMDPVIETINLPVPVMCKIRDILKEECLTMRHEIARHSVLDNLTPAASEDLREEYKRMRNEYRRLDDALRVRGK